MFDLSLIREGIFCFHLLLPPPWRKISAWDQSDGSVPPGLKRLRESQRQRLDTLYYEKSINRSHELVSVKIIGTKRLPELIIHGLR